MQPRGFSSCRQDRAEIAGEIYIVWSKHTGRARRIRAITNLRVAAPDDHHDRTLHVERARFRDKCGAIFVAQVMVSDDCIYLSALDPLQRLAT